MALNGTEKAAKMTPEERFWSRVDVAGPDACWPCTSTLQRNGYGIHNWMGRCRTAHSVAWEIANGLEIPRRGQPGHLDVDHLCHDPNLCNGGNGCPHRRCCNPAHLNAVSHRENAVRSKRAACKRNHEWTEENTIICPSGERCCRACELIRKPRKPIRPTPEHGTTRRYWRGCRCAAYTSAAAAYGLARYHVRNPPSSRTTRPRVEHEHGNIKRYWQGCRCATCHASNLDYGRQRRLARQKAAC